MVIMTEIVNGNDGWDGKYVESFPRINWTELIIVQFVRILIKSSKRKISFVPESFQITMHDIYILYNLGGREGMGLEGVW